MDHPDWNESYFLIGTMLSAVMPGTAALAGIPFNNAFYFGYTIYNGSEWLVIEEYRLPFSALQLGGEDSPGGAKNAFSYEGWGLEFKYQPQQALRSGQLCQWFCESTLWPKAGHDQAG